MPENCMIMIMRAHLLRNIFGMIIMTTKLAYDIYDKPPA